MKGKENFGVAAKSEQDLYKFMVSISGTPSSYSGSLDGTD
jgi:hypothetical protein